jgi:putative endonuclease
MAYCYVLYSKNVDKYYIGKTTNLPSDRLKIHLTDFYEKRKYTQIADDWNIFWALECGSIEIAGRIERHVKKMKSRKYLENLKAYPELGQKLLQKFHEK